ncbi:hypothetical protein LXA43DRAFT_859785, partial [Ganoderma leucocontextum]
FPAGTHGFLYYSVPPNSSPLAGELRFRITPSRDPQSFATGSVLLTERGMPWRYPLYKIVCRPNYRHITALLLQDGLVSQQTMDLAIAAVASLRISAGIARVVEMSSSTLSAFGQEFVYHLGPNAPNRCLFIGPDSIHRQKARSFASFQVTVPGGKYAQYSPFEGN